MPDVPIGWFLPQGLLLVLEAPDGLVVPGATGGAPPARRPGAARLGRRGVLRRLARRVAASVARARWSACPIDGQAARQVRGDARAIEDALLPPRADSA